VQEAKNCCDATKYLFIYLYDYTSLQLIPSFWFNFMKVHEEHVIVAPLAVKVVVN